MSTSLFSKLNRLLVFAAATLAVSVPAWGGGPYIPEGIYRVGYLVTADGIAVTNGAGECWHTPWWRPEMAVAGCDVVASVPEETAPAPVRRPLIPLEPEPEKIAVESREDAVYFGFDRFVLDDEDRRIIDGLITRLPADRKVERVRLSGFADRIGVEPYNLSLSERRASAVADYLVRAHGVSEEVIEAKALGESMPTAACGDDLPWPALVDCLQPDRRVDIEIELR